jgi:hypothetical protein
MFSSLFVMNHASARGYVHVLKHAIAARVLDMKESIQFGVGFWSSQCQDVAIGRHRSTRTCTHIQMRHALAVEMRDLGIGNDAYCHVVCSFCALSFQGLLSKVTDMVHFGQA